MSPHEYDEPLFHEAIAAYGNILGEKDAEVAATKVYLGRMLVDQGLLADGAACLEKSVEMFKEARGEDNWATGNARNHLGGCLSRMNRYADAEVELLAAYEILSAALNSNHIDAIENIERLVALYQSWDATEPGAGHAEAAEEWRAKLTSSNRAPEPQP